MGKFSDLLYSQDSAILFDRGFNNYYNFVLNAIKIHFTVYIYIFHTVHGVLKARLLKSFAIPFSSGPHFARTLHHDSSILSGLQGMAQSFTELDEAVVHVIRLVSFL